MGQLLIIPYRYIKCVKYLALIYISVDIVTLLYYIYVYSNTCVHTLVYSNHIFFSLVQLHYTNAMSTHWYWDLTTTET